MLTNFRQVNTFEGYRFNNLPTSYIFQLRMPYACV
jgi:hypothetical protein